MELKERKILEIHKNHFGQFYKLDNDNNQCHVSYGLKNTLKLFFVEFHFNMKTTYMYCIHVDICYSD